MTPDGSAGFVISPWALVFWVPAFLYGLWVWVVPRLAEGRKGLPIATLGLTGQLHTVMGPKPDTKPNIPIPKKEGRQDMKTALWLVFNHSGDMTNQEELEDGETKQGGVRDTAPIRTDRVETKPVVIPVPRGDLTIGPLSLEEERSRAVNKEIAAFTPVLREALRYIALQPVGAEELQAHLESLHYSWSQDIPNRLERRFVTHHFSGKFYLSDVYASIVRDIFFPDPAPTVVTKPINVDEKL